MLRPREGHNAGRPNQEEGVRIRENSRRQSLLSQHRHFSYVADKIIFRLPTLIILYYRDYKGLEWSEIYCHYQ